MNVLKMNKVSEYNKHEHELRAHNCSASFIYTYFTHISKLLTFSEEFFKLNCFLMGDWI